MVGELTKIDLIQLSSLDTIVIRCGMSASETTL